jgi:hypothetical protein
MFPDPPGPKDGAQRESVWASYADNLLLLAAIFGSFGVPLLALSLLVGDPVATGARAVALGDLLVAAIATLIGLWWRRRRRRSAH